jgi:hypothetical protein
MADASDCEEEDGVDAMEAVSVTPLLRGKAGSWYLMKPQDRYQYWIGRAVMVDHGLDGDSQQLWRGVRMEYWEPRRENAKDNAKLYAKDNKTASNTRYVASGRL